MKRYIFLAISILAFAGTAIAQKSIIRGSVLDNEDGSAIMFADVFILNSDYGTITDEGGFYNLTNLDPGEYQLVAHYIGYNADTVAVSLGENQIRTISFSLSKTGIKIETVSVSAERQQRRKDVSVSSISVSAEKINLLPSTGGEADIAQYLAVLPGVIFTGDQGGQLYIRGGSPVQNKILLDGMTIYNPFHSIGFYSVFETDAIQNVDVLTGGFDASYGGRVSAVIDLTMKSGNRKRTSGLVSASPFQAKALLEGPIIPLTDDNGTSLSYIITGKKSLLPYASKSLYNYASRDENGLPFDYGDIYGKFSILSNLGTNLEVFGFSFNDEVHYVDLARLRWNSWGMGSNFKIIPPRSNVIINGGVSTSTYNIGLNRFDNKPRNNSILNYALYLNLSNVFRDDILDYGIRIEGVNTKFDFVNNLDYLFEQEKEAIEMSGFVKYKKIIGGLVLDPSLRLQYYSAFGEVQLEPRMGIKYNVTDNFRLKGASGLYSQNLISTVNENEVVNLFYGFLSGPTVRLNNPITGEKATTHLQRAIHYIAGLEYEPIPSLRLNVEAYYKDFLDLININNNKRVLTDPDYINIVGSAYGAEFSALYSQGPWYLWAAYSYGFVNRDDGVQQYNTVFDRRHNLNLLGTYSFGRDDSWSLSVRWNYGSGFPFTKTRGFYNFNSFVGEDKPNYTTSNPKEIGVLYDSERLGGRLPDYHRMDISVKKDIRFSRHTGLEVTASITNVYDRANIFYFDRVEYERIDQLPILPSIGMKFYF